MNDSSKIKWLYSAVVVLIVLNIAVIGFIMTRHPPGPGRHGHPTEMVIQQLGFSDAQKQEFDKLKVEHQQIMLGIKEQNRELHNAMFAQLSDGRDTSATADSIITAIAANVKQDEMVTYHHVAQLRKICTPAQQQIFDKIISEAMAQGHSGAGPPPPGR